MLTVIVPSAPEQSRLDSQAAAIVSLIGGSPFLAPLDSRDHRISKTVDVGCGTGIATVQLAQRFPSAEVYGLDISPIPDAVRAIAPSNVTWVKGDILDVQHDSNFQISSSNNEAPSLDSIFQPNSLSYIFGRMLFLGITNWSHYFSLASQSLQPGGIIEHQDVDWDFNLPSEDRVSDAWPWHRALSSAFTKRGFSTRSGSQAAELMREAGLEVLNVTTFEWTYVPSEGTLPGSLKMCEYLQGRLVPLFPDIMSKMLGSDEDSVKEEVGKFKTDCLKDCRDESKQGLYQRYVVTVGRRPGT